MYFAGTWPIYFRFSFVFSAWRFENRIVVMWIIVSVVVLIGIGVAMEDRLEQAGESLLMWLSRLWIREPKSPQHLREPKR